VEHSASASTASATLGRIEGDVKLHCRLHCPSITTRQAKVARQIERSGSSDRLAIGLESTASAGRIWGRGEPLSQPTLTPAEFAAKWRGVTTIVDRLVAP
jgi:hypothetical protein